MKSHNILIEPWRETSSFTYQRGERLFRWTVTYLQPGQPQAEQQPGVRFGQGTARTHAEARQAAEDFLAERGIELQWQPPASANTRMLTPRSGKPRFLQL
ncbi:MAG: hypothetical protein ACFB13_03055 [Kiloniellaceae bacterium]